MGNKKATSSQVSGGGHGGSPASKSERGRKRVKKVQTKKGIKVVKKELGITAPKMYGTEASKATDDYLVGVGKDVATIGNYFKKEGGNFIRISKAEGEKLYATGDPSISRSVRLTKKGQEMKYGTSGGAMGSGDPSGIMTSIPISEAMFEKQKKIQTMFLAGMSLAMPMGGGQLMRAAAADTFQRPYSDYLSTFYKGQSGEVNFAKAERFANQGKDTANLAMGTTSSTGEKKSTKFTKKTTKYFAASYSDQARKKRKLFATV